MAEKSSAIYRRISDDREGRELGVQRQEEDCRELLQRIYDEATARRARVYTDNDVGASTRSKKRRPDFERLVEDAKAGRVNHIVAYTTSRLTRRPREFEDLIELAEQYGVTYTYVRSPIFDLNTASGRMVARVLAAKDAMEAEETGERVTRARDQIRAEGGYLGGPRPYGWEPGEREQRWEEAETLRGMARRLLAGIPVNAISRELNDAGTPTAGKAEHWQPATVRAVLRRPGNLQVLGEATALAVRAVLDDPARRTSPGNQPRWLGSRLYWCGVCQAPTLVVTGTPRTYACRPRPGDRPRHVFREARLLDAFVEAALVSRLSQPDALGLFVPARPEVDIHALHAESVRLDAKLRELGDMHDDDEIDRAEYLRRKARLEQRQAEAQAELAAAGGVDPVAELISSADVSRAWFGKGPQRAGGYSLEQRRAILGQVARVTVYSATLRGPGNFDHESVDIAMPPPVG